MILILFGAGLGLGICLSILGIWLAIRRRGATRSKGIILILASFYGLLELILWGQGSVPVANRLWRSLVGAPAIHVDGKLLSYEGTEQTGGLVFYRMSDEGVSISISGGYKEMHPPWAYLYVNKSGSEVWFKYSIPRESLWKV